MNYVYVPNSKSVVHFVLVDFGEGSSCSSCCDRGKTKLTIWSTCNELLSLDWSLTILFLFKIDFTLSREKMAHQESIQIFLFDGILDNPQTRSTYMEN